MKGEREKPPEKSVPLSLPRQIAALARHRLPTPVQQRIITGCGDRHRRRAALVAAPGPFERARAVSRVNAKSGGVSARRRLRAPPPSLLAQPCNCSRARSPRSNSELSHTNTSIITTTPCGNTQLIITHARRATATGRPLLLHRRLPPSALRARNTHHTTSPRSPPAHPELAADLSTASRHRARPRRAVEERALEQDQTQSERATQRLPTSDRDGGHHHHHRGPQAQAGVRR
jgi:hypothetical protein